MHARNRTLHASVPHFYAYDMVGYQTFTSAGQFHTWDTVKYQSNDIQYTVDTTKIFINKSGMYKINLDLSVETMLNGAILVHSHIYHNGVKVDGSCVQNSVYGTGQAKVHVACQSTRINIYLEHGDYIQAHTITNNLAATYSYPETSRILIKYIDMLGWDNDRAGYHKHNKRDLVF